MALPFLPGMSFNDPAKTSFAKSQTLNYRNGSAVHDGMTKAKRDTYQHAPPPPTWKTASGETPPPWLAFDKKILKYDAYFMESIPYSREPYRVRKCNVLYYLEDGTLAVMEPRVQNSGILQGTIVRRHKPTKEDRSPLSYQDINTCMDVKIQGVNYRVYETTDPFTIEFMEQVGYPINGFEECPGDPHTEQRDFMQKSLRPTRPAKTGKDLLRQFLDYDGKVLRFYCTLDDTRSRHEVRKFMLQFFLSDDTLSMVENLPPNCGRDPSPVFAKRQKPPKDFPHLEEISIGQALFIFNHRFVIYDFDSFTQDYYRENFGVSDFSPLDVTQSYEPVPQMEVPKHNGIGTEEDSLGSCLAIMPKTVKKDMKNLIENDKKILRFKAKMNSGKHTDDIRVFVISYFMADNSISVYEPPQRNSGIVGGKFLERRRVKRPLKPPTLRAPPPLSRSPARPPSASFHAPNSDLTQTRTQNRPTSSSSPTRTSPTPYSASTRGFGYTTSSSGYGYDPRKDFPAPLTPPLSPQFSSRSNTPSPPSSPSQTRSRSPHIPPLSPLNNQRTRTTPVAMSTMTRAARTQEQALSRTSATHDEIEAEYYTAKDFYVGAIIQIFSHVFVLQEADEFVLKHMEARPEEFPVSDINRILENVRLEMETKYDTTNEWLSELDPSGTGFVPIGRFKELLRSICPDLVEQEIITVCRRYDLDGDGQISHDEFYTAVAPCDNF